MLMPSKQSVVKLQLQLCKRTSKKSSAVRIALCIYLFRPSLHDDHLTSTAARPAFRKTCSMLVYSFNIVCSFAISSYYMYKRTTSEPKGEVARIKLV